MSVKNIPVFKFSLLHPKYWMIWLIILLLYFVVLLPYPIIKKLGIKLGRIAQLFMKYRMHIIQCNLQLCFPGLSNDEYRIFLAKNFESIGMGFVETGIAWFWPDWRIKKLFKVKGLNNILQAQITHKGILLLGLHFLTLELAARIFGILNPGVGVYRPNDNMLVNWIQTWGRLRSNKSMIDRRNVRGMINTLKNGDILWYAPDHDYGYKNSVFVPFFAVPKASTTIGTYILMKIAQPAVITFILRRLNNGKGYELRIFPNKANEIPLDNYFCAISYINKLIERIILFAPDQYMWLHRRFKTRPCGEKSFY